MCGVAGLAIPARGTASVRGRWATDRYAARPRTNRPSGGQGTQRAGRYQKSRLFPTDESPQTTNAHSPLQITRGAIVEAGAAG